MCFRVQNAGISHFLRWITTIVLLLYALAACPDRIQAQSLPGQPTGLSTEDGNTQVRLRWTGPDDPTITRWQFAQKLEPLSSQQTASFGAWTDMPGSDADTRRHTATGLLNNRTYRFKIRGVNSDGPGQESDEATGEPYPAVPEKPVDFRAIPGDGKAVLMWNHPDDVSIWGWEYRQKESGGEYGRWKVISGAGPDTTSHTVGNLANGTEYAFELQAYNGSGLGWRSDEITVSPMAAAPGKPTGLSVDAGDARAVLTWDNPGNDTIEKWQYAYDASAGDQDWTDMAGSGAETVRHVVAMLENGITYSFRIRAVNDVGPGAESDAVSAVPMAAVPGKPAGLAALAGDGQVTLSWKDPVDASILKWQYAYKTTDGFGDWIDIPGGSAATTSHVVSGLANGATYTLKIRAVNGVGAGPDSDEAAATPLPVPAKPAGLTVTAGDARATLGWNDPLNSTITGWQYAYRTSGGYSSWTDMAGSGAATTGHIVTGLANGVEHRFKIRAVNGSGHGAESDSAAATPRPVPAKPSGLRTEAGNTQVRLVWNDPGDGTISGWQYQFRTTGAYGVWVNVPGGSAATVRHTVAGLVNGTEHVFRIRALNGSGAGPESEAASATPKEATPAQPTGFRVAPGDGEALLSWDDPDDASIQGWQYKGRKSDEGYKAQWDDVPGSGAKTVRHTVTGLDNGATYSFKIRAVNAANGDESEEQSAMPRSLRPAAPTGLSARSGDGEVALAWDDPGDSSISGWQYAARTTGGFGGWVDIPGSAASTTAHTVTGLENGVGYGFKLRAVNERGGGAESGEVSATPLAIPAKPSGLTATPGDERVALAWDDQEDPSVTGWQYKAEAAGETGNWTDVPDSDAETVAHIVSGVDNGATYRFRVRALNASGSGPASDEAVVTLPSLPSKPAGLAVTPGDGKVLLAWTALGDSSVTLWQYSYRTDGGHGAWTDIPDSDAATTSHEVTGLGNGTLHTFRIRASNSSGFGLASDEVTATPFALPGKPSGFTATPGNRQALLQWDDPDNPGITGWEYKQRRGDGAYEDYWTVILGSGAATTSHMVIGLEAGVSYGFKVRAALGEHVGPESDEAAVTLPSLPAKPAGLAVTPGAGKVLLAWTALGDSSVTLWQYSYRTDGGHGAWTDIPDSDATTVGYTVSGLDNGTMYSFRIRASNSSGFGLASDEVTATPFALPGKPSGFTATPGNRQALLQWDDPDNPGITGWEYKQRRGDGAYEDYWTVILGSAAATTSHMVIGLEAGVSYGFKVRAALGEHVGPESDEAAVTLPSLPAKPAGLAVTPGAGKVLLAWTALGDSSVTLWQYSYRTDGGHGSWTDIPDSYAATTGHEVTGLDNGTLHTFRIRASNSSGFGLASDEVTATPFALPGKPSGFTATPGNRQALLQWDDPDNPGITGWEYKQRRGDGAYEDYWTVILGSGAATTSHMVIGLEAGVSYGFKVRAALGEHVGPESDEAAVTLPSLPAKPAGLAATPGDGGVLLAWTALGDSSVTLWQYSYRTDGGHGAWTDIPDSYATTVGYTVSGLDNGTMYSFRIRAANSNGSGLESDEVTATPFALPGKPSGFTATPGSGQVLLQWDDPDNPGITGWEYKQRRGDGAYEDYWTVILGSAAATTSHTVIGLEAGAAYGFKVRAVSREGVGAESDEAIVTLTPVPARPAGLVAIPGDGRVLLEWTAPADPTVTLWQYSYRTDGDHGAWTDIPDSDAATTSHEVTGLESGTPHTFRVRAANSSGFGLASDEITTVPILVLAKPEGLRVMPGDGSALLEWNDPDEPRLVRWQYVAGASGSGVADAWIDMAGSGPGTTRHVVEGLDNGTAYIFRVRFCISENRVHPDCSPGSDPVSATPEGAAAHPLARKAVKVVLADLAGRMAAGAEAAIEARLSPDAVSTRFVLAGRDLSLVAPVGEERARLRAGERMEAVGISGRDARRNSAFQFSPGPAGRDDALQWSLWHRGDLTAFEGAAGPQAHYGGQLLSGWLGVDMRWNERWLAGVALARSKAEVDYVAGAEAGVLKATFDSVHPYLQRRFRDGGTAWLILGGGRGRIENTSGGRGGETADADMASASAGYRSPLPEFGGLKISAFGAAGFARLDVDGTAQTIIGAQSVAADRQSVGIEAALDEGQTSRYAAMSLRRDGGDGTTGRGLELASGFRAPLPASLGQIDLRFRWLAWHSERNYREFGLAAHLHHQEDAGRPGLSWSLDATHGPPGGGRGAPGPLWSDEPQAPHGEPPAPVVNLRAGWNFVSPGAVFTPQAEIGLTAAHVQRLALGFDTGPLLGPMLTLAAERRTPRAGAPENRISAAMRFRF